MMKHALLLSFGLILSVSGASAQAPPSETTPPPPTALADADCVSAPARTPRSDIAPEGTTTGQASEPLADKLAKSNGVLCPPAGVDPEIHAPTPDAGNTPVIPPPGSPGGNPSVRPK
jgi:hypothetical protein